MGEIIHFERNNFMISIEAAKRPHMKPHKVAIQVQSLKRGKRLRETAKTIIKLIAG